MPISMRSRAAAAALLVVLAACGGSAAPTAAPAAPTGPPDATSPAATGVPEPSVGDQPTDAAPPPGTDAPTATDAPDPTAGATQGGSDPAIPADPALYGTGLVPDGWQVVEDASEVCRIAVPADWMTGVTAGTATSSVLAEALGAVLSVSIPWEEYKDTVDQFYLSGHETLIDTDDAFMIANPATPEFDLSYILVLRFDDVNCHLLVTVRRDAIAEHGADALLIGQTLDHAD